MYCSNFPTNHAHFSLNTNASDLSLHPGSALSLLLSVHEVLVEAAVSVTERVGPEGVDLELAGETVIGLVQVAMTGYEETGLHECLNSLGEEGMEYIGRNGGGRERRWKEKRKKRGIMTDTSLIFLGMYGKNLW